MFKRNAVAVAVLVAVAVSGSALAQSQKGEKPNPQMQKVLDAYRALGGKAPSAVTLKQAREGVTVKDAIRKVLQDEGVTFEPEKVARVEERTIPSPGGDLSVIVYTPEGEAPFPAIVYFHGGGFVLADAEAYESSARGLANQAKAVVISVNYRRAPEEPYSAAADDASAAFNYVREHAAEFGIQANKVAVAGESAGANLATVVAMRAKKEQTPLPVYQLLVYPFLGTNLATASHRTYGSGKYLISNKDLTWFWSQYLGEDWKENRDAQAVPLFAKKEDLQGLPPTLIITGGLDPLKDDATSYAKKLKDAGVEVKVSNYKGVTHEFFQMVPVVQEARQAHAEAGAALKEAFEKTGQVGSR
jgi:acetyl esterase